MSNVELCGKQGFDTNMFNISSKPPRFLFLASGDWTLLKTKEFSAENAKPWNIFSLSYSFFFFLVFQWEKKRKSKQMLFVKIVCLAEHLVSLPAKKDFDEKNGTNSSKCNKKFICKKRPIKYIHFQWVQAKYEIILKSLNLTLGC